MGEGSLREAGEEDGGEAGYPSGWEPGEIGKKIHNIAQYFVKAKAHRGGNCCGREKEPGLSGTGSGKREVRPPHPPPPPKVGESLGRDILLARTLTSGALSSPRGGGVLFPIYNRLYWDGSFSAWMDVYT